jgi:hypothetical protein
MPKTFPTFVLLIACAEFGLLVFNFFVSTSVSNVTASRQRVESKQKALEPDINGY